MQYEFSIPMPYHKNQIDLVKDINTKVKKSKITNFYFSLPYNCSAFSGFEQYRNASNESSFEYWKELIKYSIDEGFDFIYVFNSPNHVLTNCSNPDQKFKKLDFLLKELKGIGCYKLRISNSLLLTYLEMNYPDFELYASTSFEFKTIREYQNFRILHKNIKQLVPSHDLNKNFRFLKNLKKELNNDTQIELLANEGCMGGCALRREHSCNIIDPEKKLNPPLGIGYFYDQCSSINRGNSFIEPFLSNVIYPWNIKEYGKIGINHFKLVGRDSNTRFDTGDIFNDYIVYLSGIDDEKSIDDKAFRILSHHFRNSSELKLYIKDIKPYLPKIEYFKKNGHMCASDCGINCRYCYECAEKAKKAFPCNFEIE